MSLTKRLSDDGPKRILALDGGGIRGTITLGFLERIEAILRERHDRSDLRLCDYFDLIGGTSTGAIIAAGLAIGLEVADIKQLYFELGGKIFGKKQWKQWDAIFDLAPLLHELERAFGDRTLGDESLQTGLCIIVKRADTNSTWPLINHPGAKYYAENSRILLRDAVRASTAAPAYFVPETLDIGGGLSGAFVDGGVSMANNPALQLFLMATLQGYPFHWKTGENDLLLVSIGTGVWKIEHDAAIMAHAHLWDWAREVPTMLMADANWQNQLILQSLSRTPTPWPINDEIGDLHDEMLTKEPLLSYLRYNARLEEANLRALKLDNLVPKLASLRDMSAAQNRYDLAQIGTREAQIQIKAEHFAPAFDLPSQMKPLQ